MNKYNVLKEAHQKAVNDFPMKFAFSTKQFAEGMRALGLEPTQIDKIYKFGGSGGFYRQTDGKDLALILRKNNTEMESAIAEDKTGEGFIYDMFSYELANHEYGYTRDFESTLDALDYSYREVLNNPLLLKGFKKACTDVLESDVFN